MSTKAQKDMISAQTTVLADQLLLKVKISNRNTMKVVFSLNVV